MKTVKKSLAFLFSFVLVLSLACITAYAEDPAVSVSLVGNEYGAVEGSNYEVSLNITEVAAVGGAEGTITYDTGKFDFTNVSMKSSVAAANQLTDTGSGATTTQDVIKVDEANGIIKFIMLSDKTNTEWVTFNFTVKETTQAVTTANFSLSDVKVSNTAGTQALTNVTVFSAENINIFDAALSMEGATVRTDGTYDLRFEVTLDAGFKGIDNVKEVGMVLIPTALIADGKEIANDATGASFCKGGVRPNIVVKSFNAATTPTDENGNYKVYGNILNTADNHMNRDYSLRAFVVLESGETIYCDNTDSTKGIANGYCSRSCKSTAIAIYNDYSATHTFASDVTDIIAITGKWNSVQYKTVAIALLEALNV